MNDPLCLLPGPVALAPSVVAAFREPLLYHRAEDFLPRYEAVRAKLSALVGGKPVGIFVGSGTLANEAVAATLAADPMRDCGLVLVNGEFGQRLRKQAQQWGLSPRALTWAWGQPWNLADVEAALARMPGGWVWAVHHETSTGVQNDLPALVALGRKYDVRVCIDAVSSLATVPVNLDGVYLASGASGKAIGSYAGLAFVFAEPDELAARELANVPTYLDVAATVAGEGPRFTVPSPWVAALDAALDRLAQPAKRFAQIRSVGAYLRRLLREAELTPLAPDAIANPSLVTFAPPPGESAAEFVQRLLASGYQIAGQSGYLAERGLVQIAVMGAVARDDLAGLPAVLTRRAYAY